MESIFRLITDVLNYASIISVLILAYFVRALYLDLREANRELKQRQEILDKRFETLKAEMRDVYVSKELFLTVQGMTDRNMNEIRKLLSGMTGKLEQLREDLAYIRGRYENS